MKRVWIILVGLMGLVGIASCGEHLALGNGELPSNKVFVCKYVGTPGVDERLQTGQNPISVSVNAIPLADVHVGSMFADAQGRSLVIAFDTGQPEPSVDDCPPPMPPPTTTTEGPTTTFHVTTTTDHVTTTTQHVTTTTTGGVLNPVLEVEPFAFCGSDNLPLIEITFGNRPDLDGVPGILSFSDGTEVVLVFQSGTTTRIPYPASHTTPLGLTYSIEGQTETASVTLPPDCPPGATTSTAQPTTTVTGATTTTVATTTPSQSTTTTTTTKPPTGVTTTTMAQVFSFNGAATVCVHEVPVITIHFGNTFPELAGRTGTLTMSATNGTVVSTQSLVYQPGTTVNLLYPGTRINADGTIADVPGWILQSNGLWVRDPSDEFLRDGILLTYTVNPTATAFVTYPPESSECANPPTTPTSGTTPGLPGTR